MFPPSQIPDELQNKDDNDIQKEIINENRNNIDSFRLPFAESVKGCALGANGIQKYMTHGNLPRKTLRPQK